MSTLKSGLVLKDFIARGHFGEVFSASDPVHGLVAVKRMTKNPDETDDDWNARRKSMMKEAQHLKQATHRNVVQVHHLLEDESTEAILFVMDLCQGSLEKEYKTGPMPLSRLRRVATDVTHGLQALHARGLLHRDLKPGNLLIGRDGTAKLGDFGFVTDEIAYGYASGAGYVNHLAPEFFDGRITSEKTDIWALGMTFYRLLHGSEWYTQSPAPRQVVPLGGFASKLKWLPHVPKKWRRVLRTMLRDDPKRRYQTATAVFEALSSLSIEPDWKCSVSATEVVWNRDARDRTQRVLWKRSDPERNEWRAWSEPSGAGRHRLLAGSSGTIRRTSAEKELMDFFENRW